MPYTAPILADATPYPAAMWQAALDEIARLSALQINNALFVRKPADETVNGSATLQADDHLVLAAAASTTYQWRLWLIINSGVAPDFKFGWSLPAGASMAWSVQEGSTGVLAAALQGPFNAASTPAINGTASDQIVIAEGLLITSTTPGNLGLLWAQNTSTASDTKVKTSSWFRLWKMT